MILCDVIVLNTTADVGHLDFLEKASKEGEYLIVGIHTDPVSTQLSDVNLLIDSYSRFVRTALLLVVGSLSNLLH